MVNFNDINRSSNSNLTPSGGNGPVDGMQDFITDFKKKKVKVSKSYIKKMCQGLADIAYSLGETNDEEEFAEWLEEDIHEGLKKVKERRNNRKKRQ